MTNHVNILLFLPLSSVSLPSPPRSQTPQDTNRASEMDTHSIGEKNSSQVGCGRCSWSVGLLDGVNGTEQRKCVFVGGSLAFFKTMGWGPPDTQASH